MNMTKQIIVGLILLGSGFTIEAFAQGVGKQAVEIDTIWSDDCPGEPGCDTVPFIDPVADFLLAVQNNNFQAWRKQIMRPKSTGVSNQKGVRKLFEGLDLYTQLVSEGSVYEDLRFLAVNRRGHDHIGNFNFISLVIFKTAEGVVVSERPEWDPLSDWNAVMSYQDSTDLFVRIRKNPSRYMGFIVVPEPNVKGKAKILLQDWSTLTESFEDVENND